MDEWIDNIITEILDALKAFGNWMLDLLIGFGQDIIVLILDLLPTDANGTVSSGWSVIESTLIVANAWVPLDFAIGLCPVFLVFVLGFLMAKIVIKLIP